MRCHKAWMLLLAVLLLLASSVPVSAWDGSHRITDLIRSDYGHPWQDENDLPPAPELTIITGVPIGPVVITINFELPAGLARFFVKQQPVEQRTLRVSAGQTSSQPPIVSRWSEVI